MLLKLFQAEHHWDLSSFWCELKGVGDKVEQDLHVSVFVAKKLVKTLFNIDFLNIFQLVFILQIKFLILLIREELDHVEHLKNDCIKVEVWLVQIEFGVLHLREI